jgi:PAS domain S-box-containing protein
MDDAPQTGEFVLGESFAAILTETTQSLVCVLDQDGRIMLFNDACERATGFRREQVIGRDARDFVIPREERDAFGEFLATRRRRSSVASTATTSTSSASGRAFPRRTTPPSDAC